jgi:hypothetical protein
MAAPKVKFKRSSVAGKIPALSNLETGELALNTYDGKLFLKVDTGGIGIGTTVSVVNPWVENYGGTGISYDGRINITGITTFTSNVNFSGNITSNVTIVSTDTGSSAAPEFKLYRNSASPDDGDYLGQIKFAGESDTGVERNYAKITGKIKDASNGTEDGIIEIAHIKDGSQNISGRWNSETLQLINGTNLSVAGTLDVTGTTTLGVVTSVTSIEATTYYGDGSNLTGISAGAASTSNVSSNTTVSGIITASDQFYPPTLTTSERDALTVTQGALIFNTTENKVQMYLGSEWKSLAFELDTYTSIGI